MPEKQLSVLELIGSILAYKEIIIAILGGVTGAVIAPWSKWHFKENELRRADRKEKIRQWKEDITTYIDDFESFKETDTFQILKTKLSVKEFKSFCPKIKYGKNGGQIIDIPICVGEQVDKMARFKEIAYRIEKDWNLY